jgi:hypothetical protein
MRAFFVGGVTDNSELDLDVGGAPPAHYPPNTGSGVHRYRLQQSFEREGELIFAVYAAPEMSDAEVERIVVERNYAGRFCH